MTRTSNTRMSELPQPQELAEDLLHGARSIAGYLGLTQKQVYAHFERGHLPCFRIGAIICLRRSTLLDWIAQQEATAVHASASRGGGSRRSKLDTVLGTVQYCTDEVGAGE